MQEMTPVQVLRTYFGQKPGQTIAEFARELKDFSPAEKAELVTLAAAELKVTIKEAS